MSLTFQSRRVGDIIVVTCRGRIVEGAESASLQQHLAERLPHDPHIILDLGGVDFVDSSGLGLLVRFVSRARTARGDLKLCSVPARLSEILRITRLRTIFDVHDSESAAITAFYQRGTSSGAPDRFDTDILCVEQSADVLAYVGELLRQARYGVLTSDNFPDALVLLKASRPRVLVIGAELRAARGTWAAGTFNSLADALQVIPLPFGFSRHDAGDAGERLLGQVRDAIGDRQTDRSDRPTSSG